MSNNQDIRQPSKIKSGLYYGFIIVIASFFIQMLMYAPRGSFGIFVQPLAADFSWSRSLISGAFSLSSLIQGFSSIIMGWLNDRLGPRIAISICGFLVGAGMILMYFINSPWQLYIFYSLLIGLGAGGIYAPQMSTVARWFVKRRNIMIGILMSGGGLGGLIAPPLLTWIVYNQGWRFSFLVVGIIVFIVIILAAQFLKRDPSQMGLAPYGEAPKPTTAERAVPQGFSLNQALKTKHFWMFSACIFCFGYCQMSILVHIVPHAIDNGISAAAASGVLSALNIAMTTGSVILGLLADRIGIRKTFILSFCLLFFVSFLLLPIVSPWMLGFSVVVMAFGGGGIAVMIPSMIANLFGFKAHGAILGVVSFLYAFGGSAGPFITGSIFDASDNYQWAFLICSALIAIAIVLSIALTRNRAAVTAS